MEALVVLDLLDLAKRIPAFIAGAAPVNGTSVGFTPSTELSSRHVKWVIEPTPACAMFSLSEFALA